MFVKSKTKEFTKFLYYVRIMGINEKGYEMIKINDSWIDENIIESIHKEIYTNGSNTEYEIRVQCKNSYGYPIKFYKNKELRDLEFDKLGELLSKKSIMQDDKKDYIQGFKDGLEYALKINSDIAKGK